MDTLLTVFDCTCVAAACLLIAVPTCAQYRRINCILAGEFLFSIGFVGLLLEYSVPAQPTGFLMLTVKDLLFMALFFRAGAVALSKMSLCMAAYHIAFVITGPDSNLWLYSEAVYITIMKAFCAAQLLCGLGGSSHGLRHANSFRAYLRKRDSTVARD